MEEHGKSRHTIWLPDETWNRVKLLYKEDNCFSQSEFVEKAIRFYDGYLHTAKSSDFLPKVLLEVLEGTLGVYGDRLGRLLFKLAVEHNMTNHIQIVSMIVENLLQFADDGENIIFILSNIKLSISTAWKHHIFCHQGSVRMMFLKKFKIKRLQFCSKRGLPELN